MSYTKHNFEKGGKIYASDFNALEDQVAANETAIAGKVDSVSGKGLSTNDYTTEEKTKLAGIAAGAQVNTVTSVATKTGAVTLDGGDVSYSDSSSYSNGTVGNELKHLKGRINAIEEAEGLHRYGVSGIGQSANALTRIWDSVGMTAQVGTDGDNSNVINNFDDVTPFNRRKCVGDWYIEDGRAVFRVNAYLGDTDYAEDGTMGDFVAVECPRAYYYFKDGVLGVSAHQYSGWKPFDIFCHKHDENETLPFYYHPAYALALKDGKAVSLPGYDNEQGGYKELLDRARTYKDGALGNLATLMPAAYNFYEWAMYTVEFANQNCQAIMQGCAGLRHSNDDRVTFVDSTHVLAQNYFASRVAGEYIAIITTSTDINHSGYKATHKIVSATRCDSSGTASSSGTYQLLEVEDLGKNYWTYDITGSTEYRIAARPYRTGDCNGVSTPSGSPVSNSDLYHPCKYRWHENPFSNQFKTAMDLFNTRLGTGDDDYYLDWYLLDDPTDYEPSSTSKPDATDLASDKFVKLDVNTPHANYVSGYVKSRKHSEHYPDVWIPGETTGASTTTYFCDYASLVYSHSVRACRFGGYWTYGAFAGFSYLYGSAAPSSSLAFSGGDLCFSQ